MKKSSLRQKRYREKQKLLQAEWKRSDTTDTFKEFKIRKAFIEYRNYVDKLKEQELITGKQIIKRVVVDGQELNTTKDIKNFKVFSNAYESYKGNPLQRLKNELIYSTNVKTAKALKLSLEEIDKGDRNKALREFLANKDNLTKKGKIKVSVLRSMTTQQVAALFNTQITDYKKDKIKYYMDQGYSEKEANQIANELVSSYYFGS